MSTVADLTRDYRVALLRFVSTGSEEARTTGYDIGRRAVESSVSLLDLGRVHHEILIEAIGDSPAEEHLAVARAASDFFLDVLSAYDLAHAAHAAHRHG